MGESTPGRRVPATAGRTASGERAADEVEEAERRTREREHPERGVDEEDARVEARRELEVAVAPGGERARQPARGAAGARGGREADESPRRSGRDLVDAPQEARDERGEGQRRERE